jgi:hypothetical protein
MPPKKKTTGAPPPEPEAPPVSHFQPGFAPECMACPIGLVFFAVKNTRPEAMEHLMRAAFELFQAFQSVMSSYADRWEQAQQLQRIPIE